jgi:2-polyprenyl-3-methyl-5-hydroxy-6-metoxy-1,4-benzoquinol methylase
MKVVADILNEREPSSILDTPSGHGWLKSLLNFNFSIDGIDLFENKPKGYDKFYNANLDNGIPNNLGKYEAIVSCEGIEHIGNPLLFLESIKDHLNHNGLIIISTPNTWYTGAKIKFFLNGFFPSFPCLIGKIHRGSHMHIMPWSYPQLYLYMKLSGYTNINLHSVAEKKPKHIHEYLLAIPQKLYCKNKYKKAQTKEEKDFWYDAGSSQSLYGRRLVVSAIYEADI